MTNGARVQFRHHALTPDDYRTRTVGRCASQEDRRNGAAAAYGPMVDSLRYGENLIVHPFHPRHPYYWRGGRARLARNVAYSLLRRAPGSFQEVVEEARDTSVGGKGVGKI